MSFQAQAFVNSYLMQHGHGDGKWETMEEVKPSHDAGVDDPERSWQNGRIFRCKSCNEQFRVADPNASAFVDQP